MPNTTNFNWSTPADTDLVKNGASAIRTLGNSIDTSFVDLKGGTTGQVLKKTSATDLDFEWGSASSGLTLISTTTIGSAVSTVSLPTSTFTSTYDDYLVIVDFSTTTAVSAGGAIRFKIRVSGTDASTNYNYSGIDAKPTSIASIFASAGTANFCGSILSATPTRYASSIMLQGVALAQETKYQIQSTSMDGGTDRYFSAAGYHTTATAYDSMSFILDSGTMSGGKIRVYGYAN